MKILEITNLGYVNGGVETGLLHIKPVLEKMGHTVKIFTSDARPDLEHFSDYEFPSLDHKLKILKLFYRSFYPAPYYALKKVLKEYKPDIIHLHTISQISPSILFLFKKQNVVVTVHQTEDYTTSILPWSFPQSYFKDKSHHKEQLTLEGMLHYGYHRFINGNIYRIGFRFVDKFIAVSSYMQSCLATDGIKSIVLPNETELIDYTPINPLGMHLVYVGRLEHTKGVQDIIHALTEIKHLYPKIRLTIAGRGLYEQELHNLTEELHLTENIEFVGYLNQEQLSDLYKTTTIVVMPSIWPESFGKVGIEAMSGGRPVITSNLGGTSDWLSEGENGFSVPPESPQEIAKKIILLLGNPDLLEQMSFCARESSFRFSTESHVKNLLNIYQEILGSKRV